ncbi:hypothetical protein [Bacillus testis]|uniref:hypothetical protein n=1 Tax=Bacillus testis TaxID=1622072 RepID=UPI00067F537A|nr:hypothetical protein [Bacillus testis]
MIEIQQHTVNGYRHIPVSYKLLHNNRLTSHLAIMLPGSSYHVEKPLFHYCTLLYLQKNIDVLQINYDYHERVEVHSSNELFTAMDCDIQAVLEKVLEERSYSQFDLIGKSIGTIALAQVLSNPLFAQARCIWLTPLLKRREVFEAIKECSQLGYLVIGEKDPNFHSRRFKALSANSQLMTRYIPNADSSLENPNDFFKSLDHLKQTMFDIHQFIKSGDR